MRITILAATAVATLSLTPAFAQDQATTGETTEAEAADAAAAAEEPAPPPPPDDAPELVSSQGDLTECSAMLSAMSGAATSFVERDRLLQQSGMWLAAANAAGDGTLVDANERAEVWSKKVQSLRALTPHQPWLDYCGRLAGAHGLDPGPFAGRTN